MATIEEASKDPLLYAAIRAAKDNENNLLKVAADEDGLLYESLLSWQWLDDAGSGVITGFKLFVPDEPSMEESIVKRTHSWTTSGGYSLGTRNNQIQKLQINARAAILIEDRARSQEELGWKWVYRLINLAHQYLTNQYALLVFARLALRNFYHFSGLWIGDFNVGLCLWNIPIALRTLSILGFVIVITALRTHLHSTIPFTSLQ